MYPYFTIYLPNSVLKQTKQLMKYAIVTAIALLCCTLVHAQKEVYFETIDSAHMKVRSFHGVEVGVLPYKTKNHSFHFDWFSLSGYLEYLQRLQPLFRVVF